MSDLPPFPTLTTKRLVLRELTRADADDVFAFRSDPVVQQYDESPMTSRDEALAFIDDIRAIRPTQTFLGWGVALRASNQVIGVVALWDWDRAKRQAELGYGLAKEHWGQGLGQEAVGAVVEYGFDSLALHWVYATTRTANVRSIQMLERLGFQRESTWHQHDLDGAGGLLESTLLGRQRPTNG
ncbi:GNAT family N-acetyltransferase [Armatimonas rosea]|uniref:Ribosomal-protein-alanine N-acetyltransferase n=1 Tax=Armatimonas rosea TaxID=685828 RepID=A0A7W9SX99_ARMRO|nr:GNAT family N-acetyltransferase [Armatimonas rosea]MBB6053623.1 ribosomal-protein-alanine N-acetyltransferase [Armatimonas rosea]